MMNWRDLLYFSKGERQAFTILLALIILAATLLILTDSPALRREPSAEVTELRGDTIDAGLHNYGKQQSSPQKTKESVVKRYERLTSSSKNSRRFKKTEKYAKGTVVELNGADTTSLKKIPGIGSSFAKRIVKYRTLLGGYYTIEQLKEVYGMDEERYAGIAPWFVIDRSLIRRQPINALSQDSLRKHPYLNYRQAKAITTLRKQKGALIGWENLTLLEEFTPSDVQRLSPYLSFE